MELGQTVIAFAWFPFTTFNREPVYNLIVDSLPRQFDCNSKGKIKQERIDFRYLVKIMRS